MSTEVDEKRNPWKTHASSLVHDTPWISVTKHDVTNPGGKPSIYSTVHFKNLAIGVIPLDADYNTWIVGQYRYPIKQYSWEIPEGGGDRSLPPVEGAKRELLEETGIKATEWKQFLHMFTSNSATDEEVFLFVAQGLSFHESSPEDDEELAIRKVPFMELYDMVMREEITDSLTVAGVLKLKILIDRGEI